MIAVTFALPAESSDLIRQLQGRQREGDLIIGKIADRDIAITHTGVGAKQCNARLEFLLHRTRPSFVISSGFAGAVSNELETGNLIIAENFSDPRLANDAERILRAQKPRKVKLFTSTSIVDSMDERNQIARRAGAAAVDMETGAIANACQTHSVPLLSLRAISDTPHHPFPAPASVLFDIQRQKTPISKLVGYLITHPSAIARLVSFSREIGRARKVLTEALVTLIRQL